MRRFTPLFERANIDVADLPPTAEVNALFVYVGPFPDGFGRIFVHPDIPFDDDPTIIALIAHELAHIFLGHPRNIVNLLESAATLPYYKRLEDEADRLAAHLLIPSNIRAMFPESNYPTPDSLARALGVPPRVVEYYLAHPDYDARPVKTYLTSLIGQPDFVESFSVPCEFYQTDGPSRD